MNIIIKRFKTLEMVNILFLLSLENIADSSSLLSGKCFKNQHKKEAQLQLVLKIAGSHP